MNRAIIAACIWLTIIIVAMLIYVDGAADILIAELTP